MPTVSRFFLKFGLIYFIAAMLSGVAMAWLGGPWGVALLPTYLHLFVVGWITQIIIGVALWLFPKWTKEQPRGREWMSWVALITLNLGLLLRIIAEPLHTVGRVDDSVKPWLAWGLVVSGVLQWVGGMSFMLNIWGRIKPKKERPPRKKAAPATRKNKPAPKTAAAKDVEKEANEDSSDKTQGSAP